MLNGNMFLFVFCFTIIYLQPYCISMYMDKNQAVLFFFQPQKFDFYLSLSIPYDETKYNN